MTYQFKNQLGPKQLVLIPLLLCFIGILSGYGQTIMPNYPILEEYMRRSQLLGEDSSQFSFNLRPMDLPKGSFDKLLNGQPLDKEKLVQDSDYFSVLPIRQTFAFNSTRPYGWGNGPMLPNVGFQNYTQLGLSLKFSILRIQLAPEFVALENRPFQGFSGDFSNSVNRARFFYWRFGDYPERFGEESISFLWWGQSKLSLQYGAFETGISTENIFWGPGQFSSLTFSNNARSFPHLTLKTRKPAKTFLGHFEGEILIGRLEDSGFFPSQIPELNQELSNRFTGDYRYLNALTLSYRPKWVPEMTLGISRTHQQYSAQMGKSISDYLPIFEPFQKTVYGFDRDSEGRDQQVTFFGKYAIPKGKLELYFEYGKRDHAFNWREPILNPEHARAYLFGIQKLWKLSHPNQFIQIRSELLHQQESINRIIRYAGLGGGYTWHTHGQARGFANYGEALGTGPGVGSNVQTIEIAFVEKFNKLGILFERLENNQDFYYRAFGTQNERKPWIDLSIGFLANYRWEKILLSSKIQLINAMNYQWQLAPSSSVNFPKGENKFSVFGQTHLIYFFDQN